MKTVTNEVMKKFELYLYEEEKSRNTIEKYMRDIRFFFVSGYRARALINQLLSNTKKSYVI